MIGSPISNPEDWLKPEIVRLLLDKALKHNPRNFLILFMLLRTGRRIGELLELKVKDISFEESMILWNIEKKHKRLKDKTTLEFITWLDDKGRKHFETEKIYLRKWKAIDSKAITLLQSYIEEEELKPDDYVFYSNYKGKEYHLSRVTVWYFLSKYSEELGLDIHPHVFRHTFSVWIAQAMENPGDLKKLKDLLEHSDIQITESYLQFSTKDSKNLLERTFNE